MCNLYKWTVQGVWVNRKSGVRWRIENTMYVHPWLFRIRCALIEIQTSVNAQVFGLSYTSLPVVRYFSCWIWHVCCLPNDFFLFCYFKKIAQERCFMLVRLKYYVLPLNMTNCLFFVRWRFIVDSIGWCVSFVHNLNTICILWNFFLVSNAVGSSLLCPAHFF